MTLPSRPLRPETPLGRNRDRFEERDLDASKATVARVRRLRDRLVKDGDRTYFAYSADELIAIDTLNRHERPGRTY